MQFYALKDNLPTLASHAEKQKDYHCPECKSVVRVRSGPERQPHFYHLAHSSHCRLHQKSATHLQAQLAIMRLLPPGESTMERQFPEISRIADLAWEKKKIVFEIQCSPISLDEASQRCSDYQKAGFSVIWILHVRRFNRRKIGAAENFLRKIGAYYTNFDEKGYGEIFDQFEICRGARRIFCGPRLCVNLAKPKAATLPEGDNIPYAIKARTRWPLSFCGDLSERFLRERTASLYEIEKRFFTPHIPRSFLEKIKRLYLTFFRLALEKTMK
ncbi:MAG: competence protein CoiA [Chlamydiales bacterium]